LTDNPRDDIGRNASRETNNDPHRPCGIGLRPDIARGARQRNSDRGQMEEIAAAKFHGLPNTFNTLFCNA
jgi:hypothetical protein